MESRYKRKLAKKIEDLFPGCIILRNNPNDIQAFPDWLILYRSKWAALEVKDSEDADHQPNQDYYVELTNEMSFGSFIYPENEREVLYELQQAFGDR